MASYLKALVTNRGFFYTILPCFLLILFPYKTGIFSVHTNYLTVVFSARHRFSQQRPVFERCIRYQTFIYYFKAEMLV